MRTERPTPEDIKMYTREEVAKIIGCHKDHVTTLSQIGCLSAIRIGKRYMFSHEAIKQFQHDYNGYDLSNRKKAIQAYQTIQQKKLQKSK